MGCASELARNAAQFPNDGCADLASKSRFVEMGKEESPQARRRDFAREIRIIDLVADAISPFLRGRLELARVGTRGGQRCLLASGAGKLTKVVSAGRRTRRMQDARSQVSHRMLDDAGIEMIDCGAARNALASHRRTR